MKSSDIVIVGGGAAGCMTAYYLARAGHKSALVEMEAVGSHASGFAFGGLNQYSGAGIPGPVFPLAKASYEIHERLFAELRELTGMDIHYRKVRNMKLAFTDDEAEALQKEYEWHRQEGMEASILDGEEVQRREPRINPEAARAELMEGAGVEAYRLVVALIQAAEKLGANQRHGRVVGIKRNGSRPSALVFASGHELPCDTVVISMGPWSKEASRWLGFPIPVEPLKGQILRLEMDGEPLACAASYGHSYLGSKPDGLIWCGTTEEEAGFDDKTTSEGAALVMEDALKMVPSLEDARLVLQTACLRPMSADLLPIIGPAPGWEGVYLATGAGRKGILLSAAMGQIVTELITEGKTSLDISALLPDRFAPVKR